MGRLLQRSNQNALRHVKGTQCRRHGQNLTAINSAFRGLAPLAGPMRQNHAMAERVIPLVDQRIAALAARVPTHPVAPTGQLTDTLGRPLRDLRISVTDRCNFRCNYCMPKEVFDKDYPYLPHGALLSFEEITRLAKLFLAHGVRKIRLTGGEPLLRKNLEALVEQLAAPLGQQCLQSPMCYEVGEQRRYLDALFESISQEYGRLEPARELMLQSTVRTFCLRHAIAKLPLPVVKK